MDCQTSSSKQYSPATEALDKALSFTPKHVISKDKPMISFSKRSRETFDMSEFEDASKEVDDSIAFPSIGWSFNDDDEDEQDDDFFNPSSKRVCTGLGRSKESFNLAALASSTQCCERRGSTGSLC